MGAVQVGVVHQHRCPDSQLCLVSRSGTKSALNLSETPGGREEGGQEEEEEVAAYTVSQLSVSPDNTIIHFLHLDVGEGVFLAPLSPPSGRYNLFCLFCK